MIEIINECCGCSTESYPCLGDACSYRHVPHFICDECDDESTLYEYEGKQLCVSCILSKLTKVDGSDLD